MDRRQAAGGELDVLVSPCSQAGNTVHVLCAFFAQVSGALGLVTGSLGFGMFRTSCVCMRVCVRALLHANSTPAFAMGKKGCGHSTLSGADGFTARAVPLRSWPCSLSVPLCDKVTGATFRAASATPRPRTRPGTASRCRRPPLAASAARTADTAPSPRLTTRWWEKGFPDDGNLSVLCCVDTWLRYSLM